MLLSIIRLEIFIAISDVFHLHKRYPIYFTNHIPLICHTLLIQHNLIIQGTKLALIQLLSGDDKDTNVKNAVKMIETAKNNSADIAILPECFNSPYGTSKPTKIVQK